MAELQRVSHLLISMDCPHRGRNDAAESAPYGQNIRGTMAKGDPKHRRDSAVSGLAALPRPAPASGRAEQRCGDTLPLQWPNTVGAKRQEQNNMSQGG